MSILKHIKDRLQGKVPAGAKRSSKWPKVRAEHLEKNPNCAVCGSSKNLDVHHCTPFHKAPSKELAPSNLITLCEGNGVNCHITFGHLGNFRSFNVNVKEDAKIWNQKLKKRPV